MVCHMVIYTVKKWAKQKKKRELNASCNDLYMTKVLSVISQMRTWLCSFIFFYSFIHSIGCHQLWQHNSQLFDGFSSNNKSILKLLFSEFKKLCNNHKTILFNIYLCHRKCTKFSHHFSFNFIFYIWLPSFFIHFRQFQ